MRRALLMLLLAAGPGLSGVQALAQASAKSTAQPPAANLLVELRFVADGGELPRSGRGSVTVGTQGSTPLSGSVTVTTATTATPREDSLLQLRVLNGASAQLRLSQLVPVSRLQWRWRGQPGPGGAASGADLAETTQWVDTARGMTLRPSWPGGAAPVRVEVRVELAADAPRDSSGHAAGPRQLQLETTALLPLGEWFVLGRTGRPPPVAADSATTVSTAARGEAGNGRIELRVLAP